MQHRALNRKWVVNMRSNSRGPKTGFPISLRLVLSGFVLWAGALHSGMGQIQRPLQHEVTVVNIAVPTRVFDGDRFVDNLTANDFIVLENGVVQKVEAAYLIRKTNVLQNATVVGSSVPVPVPVEKPDESLKRRHFVLIFEMDEYLPQLSQAIDLFFNDVLTQDDTLRIITPENAWEFKKGPLTDEARAKMADDLKSRLRKSLTLSGSQLKRLITDLRITAQEISDGSDPQSLGLVGAREIITQIVSLKSMNVRNYKQFANFMKSFNGQRYAFIFYQKETYIIPSLFKKAYEEEAGRRVETIERREIEKIFADADTTAHFIFLTRTKGSVNDVEWRNSGDAVSAEMSGDFYSAFRDLADATGGISEATANPIYGFKKAVEASENYYVVYYRPAEYKADGKYKEITVKVKGGRYRVTHRAGYIDK
jgi:hypothetical protein